MGKLCVIFMLSFMLAYATARNIPGNALAPAEINTENMAISAASPAGNGVGDQKNFITFGGVGGWAGVGGIVGVIPVLGGIGGVGAVPVGGVGGVGGAVPVGGIGGVGGAAGGVGGGAGGVGGGILP